MAITIEGTQTVTSSATSATVGVTIPANTEYIVCFSMYYESLNNDWVTISTIGGFAAVLRASHRSTGNDCCECWTVKTPGTGAQNLVYSKPTGPPNQGICFQLIYLSGVDEDNSPRGTHSGTQDSGTGTATLTTATGDLCLLGVSSDTAINGAPSGSNQTEIEDDTFNSVVGMVSREDGEADGSTNMTYTITGTGYTGFTAISLIAAAGGVSVDCTQKSVTIAAQNPTVSVSTPVSVSCTQSNIAIGSNVALISVGTNINATKSDIAISSNAALISVRR